MSKRKDVQSFVQGFSTNPVDKALYADEATEETDALFSALSDMKRGNTAIVTDGSGAMELAGWQMTPTGLIPPDRLQESQYQEFGRALLRLDTSMQWLIGDYVNIGDNFQWGQTYRQLAEEFGYSEATLKQYAYVARNVKKSVRTDELSFGHHERVAGMTPDEQAHWLGRAANKGLSIANLRKAIKESQLPPPEPHDIDELNAKMPPGVSVEHVGTYSASNFDQMGSDLAEALNPTPPPQEQPPAQSKPLAPSKVKPDTQPVGDGFDHDQFRDMQKAWDKARDAFGEVRSVHMSALTHGSVPRSTRKRALELIRMLNAHLNYIETKL